MILEGLRKLRLTSKVDTNLETVTNFEKQKLTLKVESNSEAGTNSKILT